MRKKMVTSWIGVLVILMVMSVSYLLAIKYAKIEAAKKVEAKIIAENKRQYKLWESINEVSTKAGALNQKIVEIGNITKDDVIMNFEESEQLLELLKQKKTLHEEFGRLIVQYDPGEQLIAWMGVDTARDSYLTSQIHLNNLTLIKSKVELDLYKLKKRQANDSNSK